MAKTFLYFAFGSNLLKERLRILNPSAVFVDVAKLSDYKLGFDWAKQGEVRDRTWKGCPANITPSKGHEVWGAVWRLHLSDMPNLDEQEGVPSNIYRPIEVQVISSKGEQLTCRTYTLVETGIPDNRPSPQYLDIIIRGAKQCSLPADYLDKLKAVEHNGFDGQVPIYEEILESLQNSQ